MDSRASLATNGRIAAALIDVLVASGDTATVRRAISAGGGDQALRSHAGWLPEAKLAAMFCSVTGNPRLPERVGRALVCSSQAGFVLRYSGLATPERAYRTCDQILAREAPGSIYEVAELQSGHARVVFHPASEAIPQSFYCSLRRGMLEGLPLAYGLLPARVRETECAGRGGEACVYEVRWRRSSRVGLIGGALVGVALGAGLGLWAGLGAWQFGLAAVAPMGLLCALAGHSIDLARQLDAVAGSRRGQLALLDEADRSLAEKMDQFARLEAVESAEGDRRSLHFSVPGSRARGSSAVAGEFQSVDLVAVVRRAAESQGSHFAARRPLQLELPDAPMWLDGEPVQLEMVVVQLIRNALAAVPDSEGAIRVSLREEGDRLELAVEDDGLGIGEENVDEVFDPFVGDGGSPGHRGMGLAVAYRVVKEHGGELRFGSAEGQGTRVTALLPRRREVRA